MTFSAAVHESVHGTDRQFAAPPEFCQLLRDLQTRSVCARDVKK
jgi:hypothetical protein